MAKGAPKLLVIKVRGHTRREQHERRGLRDPEGRGSLLSVAPDTWSSSHQSAAANGRQRSCRGGQWDRPQWCA